MDLQLHKTIPKRENSHLKAKEDLDNALISLCRPFFETIGAECNMPYKMTTSHIQAYGQQVEDT